MPNRRDGVFGDPCRAANRNRTPCRNRSSCLIPVSSRREVLRAIRSGWPMCLPRMTQPTTRMVGVCRIHQSVWDRRERAHKPFVLSDGRQFIRSTHLRTRSYRAACAAREQKLKDWQAAQERRHAA